MSIHSRNDQVILEFGLHKPAFRICVNTPTTHGSIGLTTGLDPAMTLGCGGYGGNITSDNITPRHLLNIKRVAYELRPRPVQPAGAVTGHDAPAGSATAASLPRPPRRPQVDPLPDDDVRAHVDRALAARGVAPGPAPVTPASPPVSHAATAASVAAEFVCEDDVTRAARSGARIVIGPRTIVTPAARDAAASAGVFVWMTGEVR